MDSRTKILNTLASQEIKSATAIPFYNPQLAGSTDVIDTFKQVLKGVGGAVLETKTIAGVEEYVLQNYEKKGRIVTAIPMILGDVVSASPGARTFDNVEVAVIKAHFGVAENGAVWITDDLLADRALPFICQHLIVVLEKSKIVYTLHDAYDIIGTNNYSFGTFIAGPSKTADIEQSLVLGAHGPKTMTVFLLDS
jgi:L-lactate dehydrogenase complex protein LldG